MNVSGTPAYPTRRPAPVGGAGAGPVTPVLVATSDNVFYLWQVLVQVQHFTELGMLDRVWWVVYHQGDRPSQKARQIARETGAQLIFRKDPRNSFVYNPAMKPWLIGQAVAELGLGRFHYLDPDVMLTQDPEFYDQVPGWSGSLTDSYTGPEYLKSHGEDLWVDLCGIAGVAPDIASLTPGVGAQWVVEGTDQKFWDDVRTASIEMYQRCRRQPKQPGQQYAVQTWCAEMYATHLVALAYGFPVYPDPALEFLWANGEASRWADVAYFHNAGVTEARTGHFFKGEHQSSPFRKPIPVDEGSASYYYLQLVRRTEQAWPELIW